MILNRLEVPSWHGEDFERHWGFLTFAGKVVLDVGADYGSTAAFFLNKGASKVICVESYKPDFVRLETLAKKEPRIEAYERHISSADDWKFFLQKRPEIAKIDCEGCEGFLLDVDADSLNLVSEYAIELHNEANSRQCGNPHDKGNDLKPLFVDKFSKAGFAVETLPQEKRVIRAFKEVKQLSYAELTTFIPYTIEDFGIVIPHRCDFKNRWEWFWPRFRANIPKALLQNVVVVLHTRPNAWLDVKVDPDPGKLAEECQVIVNKDDLIGLVKPFQLGLGRLSTRLVARVANDIEFRNPNWVEEVLKVFNEEPHFKILASCTIGYPSFDGLLKRGLKQTWMRKHLLDGKNNGVGYFHGGIIIANRGVWKAYYSEMLDYTNHDLEDVIFSILSRADGIPLVHFPHLKVDLGIRHRGKSNRDEIV